MGVRGCGCVRACAYNLYAYYIILYIYIYIYIYMRAHRVYTGLGTCVHAYARTDMQT